jgi:type II secretory pathway pseudopilin PulG
MKLFKKPKKGFTLVELILYIAITGLVASSLVLLTISVSKSKDKNYIMQEVNGNVRKALSVIQQTIRSATSTNAAASTFGSDPGVISLAMDEVSKNPTIINLSADDGVLQIKEGTSSTISITSSEVKITNFVLTDLSVSSTRENIRVQITAKYNNGGTDVNYDYTLHATSTISMRK